MVSVSCEKVAHFISLSDSLPVLPVVQSSSAGIAVQDRDVGPLRVVPNGEVVTLFALVTAYPCPTIQWRQNRNSIRQSDVYTISDPCPPDGSPGSTFYNFTLNITVTIGTVGNYTARLINAAGVVNVEGVFVTQPGTPIAEFPTTQFVKN